MFIIASAAQLVWINRVGAFTCYDATKNILNSGAGSGTANVYVDPLPGVAMGQSIVVELSQPIFCRNDQPTFRNSANDIRHCQQSWR